MTKTTPTTKDITDALKGLRKLVTASYDEVWGGGDRLREIFTKAAVSLTPEEETLLVEEFNKEIGRMRALMHRDELTGLYNRRGISEEFGALFNEALFEKEHTGDKRRSITISDFSIIFVDVDDLKKINDAHGHAEGDRVLREVARVLTGHVRKIDAAGRLGGEEFVLALLGADEDAAFSKAEKIRAALAKSIFINNDKAKPVTASIGVASLRGSRAKTLQELVDRADKAMYEAKQGRGKNAVVRYSELKARKA